MHEEKGIEIAWSINVASVLENDLSGDLHSDLDLVQF